MRQDVRDVELPLARAGHAYWRARRAAAPRPLLHALWFEQPWALAAGDAAAGAPPLSRTGSAGVRGRAGGGRGGGRNGSAGGRGGGGRAGAALKPKAEVGPVLAHQPFMGLPAARSVGPPGGRLRRMDLEQVNGKLQAIRCGGACIGC